MQPQLSGLPKFSLSWRGPAVVTQTAADTLLLAALGVCVCGCVGGGGTPSYCQKEKQKLHLHSTLLGFYCERYQYKTGIVSIWRNNGFLWNLQVLVCKSVADFLLLLVLSVRRERTVNVRSTSLLILFFFFSFPLPRLFSKQLLRMLCKLQVIGWQFFFTAVTDSTHCCWGAAEGTGFANHYEMQKAQGQNPSKFDMKDKWNQNAGLVRPLFCLTKFPPITEQQCLLKGWI